MNRSVKTKFFGLLVTMVFSSCMKEKGKCDKASEIPTSSIHKIDITEFRKNPYIKYTLDKYENRLQVDHITEFKPPIEPKACTMIYCNMYYKGFKIFFPTYHIRLQDDQATFYGRLPPETINLNLKPVIMINEAIRTAKQKVNFGDNCLAFQLGILDIRNSNDPDYKLVWLIQNGNDNSPRVFINAHTGEAL